MSEQWFLDLDGVRSGPYQTSEVMSLVAEGEVLPHHQIATDLKSQKWMTILEWRLNQNKNSEPKKESPAPLVSPAQEKPSPVIATTTAPSAAPIAAATAAPVATPPPTINPSPASSKPAGKRDPMAEMFDMLQNTKQKREVKAQQTHAQAHSHSHSSTANLSPNVVKSGKGNWGKTIAIGVVITIIGFALGQFFQHQKNDSATTAANAPTSAASPAPSAAATAPVAAAVEMQNGAQPAKEEVMDRSTDKMTIRSVPSGSPTEHSKDIQELKDLKKELLELKALKDEIRGTGDNPDNTANAPDGSKNNLHYDMESESNTPPVDDEGNPIDPNDPGAAEVHY